MSKKQIRVLFPLGLLLVTLVVLAGCRPSTALTRLMDAINALNPGTEETMTEEEQEEDRTSSTTDPMDEERDDAKIEEMDILIGQLLENMDEEEAQAALQTLYSEAEENHEWGAQQYNPDLLNEDSNTGALALYVRDHNIRLESNRTDGTGNVISGTGAEETEGVPNSSGTLQSSRVPLTMEDDTGQDTEGSGSTDNDDADMEGVDSDANNTDGLGGNPTEGGPDPDLSGDGETPTTETPAEESDTPSEEEPTPEPSSGFTADNYFGHRIVAVGQAAVMVCMLGGADRLVATSPDFNSDLTQRAFNRNGQMNYTTLWNGLSTDDGSEPMTETEFEYLLDVVQPDACVVISGQNTFDGDDNGGQLARLKANEIPVYTIGSLTSQSDIEQSLYNLAWYMDSDPQVTGTPATDIYGDYMDWVDYYVTQQLDKSKKIDQQTIFIEDWDDTVQTVYTSANGSTTTITTGAAIVRVGYRFRPLRDYLVNSRVYDWASGPNAITTTGYDFNSNFGKADNTGTKPSTKYEWDEDNASRHKMGTQGGDLCYVSPVYHVTDYTAAYSLSFVGGRAGVGVINNNYVTTNGTYAYGDGDGGDLSFGFVFPGLSNDVYEWGTVITRTKDVADALDYTWEQGTTTFIESKNFGEGSVNIYGRKFTTTKSGQSLTYYTTIQNECNYEILVNPVGCLGSWVDGSVESVLESIWASCYISHYYSEGSMKSAILNFYSEFYGLDDLTDNEYKQIMNEE